LALEISIFLCSVRRCKIQSTGFLSAISDELKGWAVVQRANDQRPPPASVLAIDGDAHDATAGPAATPESGDNPRCHGQASGDAVEWQPVVTTSSPIRKFFFICISPP
jgi:hypothetical protein